MIFVVAEIYAQAIGGGVSGALAGVAQVLLLMWLRTTINYQYRNGGGTVDALKAFSTPRNHHRMII